MKVSSRPTSQIKSAPKEDFCGFFARVCLDQRELRPVDSNDKHGKSTCCGTYQLADCKTFSTANLLTVLWISNHSRPFPLGQAGNPSFFEKVTWLSNLVKSKSYMPASGTRGRPGVDSRCSKPEKIVHSNQRGRTAASVLGLGRFMLLRGERTF